jgi:glyoxylase-like metal-dependent hydrolase (beta-lactamase superfamily II)
MSLVFNRDLDAQPGRVDVIGPGIRRVLAPNPGPFTFLGTGTYIVGEGRHVAVIDPGPKDDAHINALVDALAGETVSHIFVTHTHADHSPAARPLQERVGGTIVGCAPHPAEDMAAYARYVEKKKTRPGDPASTDESTSEDHTEEPFDAEHVADTQLFDGEVVSTPGWTLEAVATPGHIANHLCFAFREANTLFSGDHVMAWSTSVVSPPAGDLVDYLASLNKVLRRSESTYWPTHGPAVTDPQTFVTGLIEHRHHRTAQVLAQLATGPKTIPQLVTEMYLGLDDRLVKAAGRSVLSHLLALRKDSKVAAQQADLDRLADDDTTYELR